jgi:Ca2+-binding RTX toxin-like protein
MALQLDGEDIADLLNLVRTGQIRDSSGYGNNVAHPTWGTAAQPFIRLTNPYYTDGASGMRTTVNTPRQISDIVSNQDNDGDGIEESIPNAFGGSALLTFFGQYFDHGLDFVPKGASGRVQIGSDGFPITASRANIIAGTGIDPDGIPNNGDEIAAQHLNMASPYVDQNQAYGSHEAVTDLLRKWETGPNGKVQTAYLLTGDLDGSGRALLPTLNHIRENYRIMTGGQELTSEDISNFDGTGHALLLDFVPSFMGNDPTKGYDLDKMGHYFVAGDGRLNENVMLTSIHTIWARNHNFWVDVLKERTGNSWTEEEYFQAAKIVNVAEYQRVVFTEFADAMAGGIDPGENEHGFDGYDPGVDASISAEFAHVAYRFGHSMLNETVSYKGADGIMGQLSLVQAFLNPGKVKDVGIEELLLGATGVTHQAIDVDVVNALRNQLVGQPLDLAALNIFRGRDTGIAPFNTVRAELYAKTGNASLRPYSGWADFQSRNGLSDAFINQLKQAYPEGFQAMDLWIGGLAEKPAKGQLGSTFGYIFLEQLDRLQDGDRFYYLEILDDSLFQSPDNAQTFADIIMRNTGITGLSDHVFLASSNGSTTGSKGSPPANPPPPLITLVELTERADRHTGTSKNEIIKALGGNDTVDGAGGDDEIWGGSGHDMVKGGGGKDHVRGEAGEDKLYGGDGNDTVDGGAGDDKMWGEKGDDTYRVDSRSDSVTETADGGTDTVEAWSSSFKLGAYVEHLVYKGGGAFSGTGNDLGNHITGGSMNDILDGAGGHDTLKGLGGADNLKGGGGNDTMEGGAGNDTMDGGTGNDVFVFHKEFGRDTIKGFDADPSGGQDKLDVSALLGEDVGTVSITASGRSTVIAFGDDVIVLEGVNIRNISETDFLL